MARALSIKETGAKTYKLIPFEGVWADAFGTPEKTGVWFVWGRSGHGKTSFVMQLCKELCKHYKGAYNSLEEGVGYTMQETLRKNGMISVNKRLVMLDREPITELEERMDKRMSPHFYIIDSFQYTNFTFAEYLKFKERHRNKLIIFISQADGTRPKGRTADRVCFDATQKIYVEGFRAFSNGRSTGPVGYYDVWHERAQQYWGKASSETTTNK